MLPKLNMPPAPSPQNALAAIKLFMLCAKAHQTVETVKRLRVSTKGGLRPIVSDRRPKSGWNAVEVRRKAVDSHDAEFEA